jgi:predicted MFS family arabinose efflux permease
MLRSLPVLYRNAYSGLSPSIWLQALVMLINRSGTMVIPFLTVYLTQSLHFSIAESGEVLSVFGAGAVCGVYAGGKLTDKIGFFPVQFWSLLLNGLLFLVLGQLRHLWPICGCVFLLALIGESFRPANAAATAFYSSPDNRTRSYSLNRLAVNLGFAVGPAVGGLLATVSYGWLFWTDGLTCIIAALMLRWLLRPSVGVVHAAPAFLASAPVLVPSPQAPVAGAPDRNSPSLSAYKDRTYLRFIFFVWMNALSFFQLFSVLPLYYKTAIHMSDAGIGLILAMNGLLIAVVEMVLVYRLENKRPEMLYISYGVLLTALSFGLLAIGGPYLWVAILSMLSITFGEMMSMPFMNSYWISRSSTQNRGQYAALYGIAYSAAQVIAPALGGQVAQYWGFTWLWVILIGIGLLTFWGFRYRLR